MPLQPSTPSSQTLDEGSGDVNPASPPAARSTSEVSPSLMHSSLGGIAGVEGHTAERMLAAGRLATGVAHDLSNILTAIRGFARVVGSDLSEGSPARRALDEVVRASDRGAALTRQLINVGRPSPSHRRVADVGECLERLRPMLERTVPAPIEVRTTVHANRTAAVGSDREIELMLLNVILNARDAIGYEGLVEIDVTSACRREAGVVVDEVVIAVRDSGRGMPAAVRDRIFEPFFTTKERSEGTGLGLSLVRDTLRAIGGDVVVESAPGKGTTFTLFLRGAVELAGLVDKGSRPATVGADGAGLTVLVCDDDPAVMRLVVRLLERRHFNVLSCSCPSEATELFRSQGEKIDVVVMDVVIPESSGPELMARLRAQKGEPPTLFLTGYPLGGTPWVRNLPESDRLLLKPFTVDQFYREFDLVLACVDQRAHTPVH